MVDDHDPDRTTAELVTGPTVGPPAGDPTQPYVFPIGSLINGRYRVAGFLGAGGMGSVFRVVDILAPDRPLALKTLREDVVTQDRVDLFKSEFKVMAAFHHPNVASVYDFEPIHGSGRWMFTMEFVEGRDIFSATEGADLEAVLDLFVGACRALAYVHSRGVIHFDLKPSNLLVSVAGRVKVLDFGVAGTVRQAGRRLFGTPVYMAPELLHGRTPDQRADLYSLGVILHRLITRRLLAGRPDAADIATPWVAAIVERLCREEPADRFRSANAVIEAINREGHRSYELETPQTRESYILSSRFIGRERELQRLVDFIGSRTHGGAQTPVLLVSGSSGIGKSRLIREARHHSQLSGLAFVEAQCYEGSFSDYGPLFDAMKQLGRLAEATGAAALVRIAPPELTGASAGAALSERQNPIAERERLRLREDATDFLVRLAQVVPYVLCVNDLQWAQPATIDLMTHLARRLSIERRAGTRAPLAVLGTFRDEEIAGRPCESLLATLREWAAGEVVSLTPLDPAGVGELVTSMLGADPPADFVQRLMRETTGVPFFVEEIMRALVESGSVYVESGVWAAAAEASGVPIPTSIVNVLRRRVEALDVPARHLLAVLAAYGRPAPVTVLAAAANLDAAQSAAALKCLVQRQMAIDEAVEPVAYTTAHDRLREIVYSDLPAAEKTSIHASIAAAIQGVGLDDLNERVYQLAQHYWRAGDRSNAFTYCRLGAERAWSRYENDLAIELFARVLELAEDDEASLRLEVTEKLGDLHALNGRFDEALTRYQEVLTRAVGEAQQARLFRKIASVHWQRGELVLAVDRLWQAAEALGDSRPTSRAAQTAAVASAVATHVSHRLRPVQSRGQRLERARLLELAAIYFQLGEVYFFHDSSQMLLPILRASNAGEQAGGDSMELCRAYHAVMVLYGTLTLWGSAAGYLRRLTEMADRLQSPWYIGAAHTYATILHYYRSEWDKGIAHGRLGRDLLQQCGDVMELSFACWVTALCHYHRGRLREGAVWARESLETMQRTASAQPSKGILAVYARINVRLGHQVEARAQIEQSLALASQARDLMFLSWAQMIMGDYLLVAGQADQAVAWLENARRIREDNSLLPEYLVEIYSLLATARLEELAAEGHLRESQRRRRLRAIAAIARTAMRLARRRRHHYISALRAAGSCAWRLDERRRATHLFEKSLQIAVQIDSPLQRAETLEVWGRYLVDAGDDGRARRHLEEAAAIYSQAGATPLVERVTLLTSTF